LVAQYTGGPSGATQFVHADHLGSTRLVTNLSGSVIECDDYLPYGELLSYGGSVPCNNTQSTTHKFTSKERDVESNLDYFGARYYTSTLGRFVTSDWALTPEAVPYADYTDPQTLNLYGYVRNNPLSKADADGHDLFQAWNDLKAAVHEVYYKVAAGGGFDADVKIGPAHAVIGASARLSFESSPNSILKVSAAAEAGVSAQVGSFKAGESVSSETPLLTVHNDKSVSGVENTTHEVIDTLGGHTTAGSNSSDRTGVGVELGDLAHGGAEIGLTKRGVADVKDAVIQVKNSLKLPPAPASPIAPAPPKDQPPNI
jgi:RHS repeat-associated protein